MILIISFSAHFFIYKKKSEKLLKNKTIKKEETNTYCHQQACLFKQALKKQQAYQKNKLSARLTKYQSQ